MKKSNNIFLKDFKFVDFTSTWKRLKPQLTRNHLELFYNVVDIDGTLGRRIYPGCGREDNPRFYTHWFACGRCHWNVILPCFMLNGDDFIGDFKIITNDKHSAIVDMKNKRIMCPTLNSKKYAEDFFRKGFEIEELFDFLPTVLKKFDSFKKFMEKHCEK